MRAFHRFLSSSLIRALAQILALAALAGPARAACPAALDQVDSASTAAMAAFRERRAEDVRVAAAGLRQDLGCLQAPLPPELAARAHLAIGAAAFLDKDGALTLAAFAAARKADPSLVLPEDLVPAGHPLRLAFEEAATLATAEQAMRAGPGAELRVDGRPGSQRPTQHTTIVQTLLAGQAQDSAFLTPADRLPGWASLPEPLPAPAVAPAVIPPAAPPASAAVLASAPPPTDARDARPAREARRGPSRPLLWTAATLGLGSAALWAAALVDNANYDRRADSYQDAYEDGDLEDEDGYDEAQDLLDRHRARVNGLGIAAQATSASAALMLGASFVF